MSTLLKSIHELASTNMANDDERHILAVRNSKKQSRSIFQRMFFWRTNHLEKSFTFTPRHENKYDSVDELPPGISLITSFRSRGGPLNFMVANPNGFIYTACENKIVWFCNQVKEVRGFKVFYGDIVAVVVGPQGHIISSHCDGTIRVWKKNGKIPFYDQVMTLPTQVNRVINKVCHIIKTVNIHAQEPPISCLYLSEDKFFVYSGSFSHTVKVWRVRDWRHVETIQGSIQIDYSFKRDIGQVNAITTGSGDLMFYGSNDGSVQMFRRVLEGRKRDKPKHKLVRVLLSQGFVVRALLFKYAKDGTGQLLACLADGTLRFWQEKNDWRFPETLSYHTKAVTCIAGLSGSLVFSGSLDGKICVWNTEHYNGKPLQVLAPQQGSVYSLAVRDDWEENIDDGSRRLILYSHGQDGTVKIWRINPQSIRI